MFDILVCVSTCGCMCVWCTYVCVFVRYFERNYIIFSLFGWNVHCAVRRTVYGVHCPSLILVVSCIFSQWILVSRIFSQYFTVYRGESRLFYLMWFLADSFSCFSHFTYFHVVYHVIPHILPHIVTSTNLDLLVIFVLLFWMIILSPM